MKTLTVPNISSVPQYSPLRYPGGKSRLYPFVKKWIACQISRPRRLIEPFAGAAHVGLAAAIENMVDQVILVDIDDSVSAVWRTILSDDCHWLIDSISKFKITRERLRIILDNSIQSDKDRAFQAIVRNRVNRGGIIAPGSGMLDQGENGKGLSSRWYPNTLKKRIEEILKVRHKIEYVMGDGFKVMNDYSKNSDTIFFVDPPYPISGRRLYKHFEVNPYLIFETMSFLNGDFIITYEDTLDIRELISKYSWDMKKLEFSTTHHYNKTELLISRDLSWLTDSPDE